MSQSPQKQLMQNVPTGHFLILCIIYIIVQLYNCLYLTRHTECSVNTLQLNYFINCVSFVKWYFCFVYRASYSDGKLKSPPKPCAGNQGTLISVGLP